MYTEEQKRDHIREIQRLIYEISFYNESIPIIIPDGIYGAETQGAVKIFQQEYALPATGSVDFETWEMLVKIYRQYYPVILMPDIFKKNMVLRPGGSGTAVYMIQLMLNTIGTKYITIPALALTGVYDRPTELAVESFKGVTGNNNSANGVDVNIWNDMVAFFNKLVS